MFQSSDVFFFVYSNKYRSKVVNWLFSSSRVLHMCMPGQVVLQMLPSYLCDKTPIKHSTQLTLTNGLIPKCLFLLKILMG